jgi:hypothetical protein
MAYSFPGGFHFIGQISGDPEDAKHTQVAARLGPLQQAMQHIGNAVTQKDDDAKKHLIQQAIDQKIPLQMALQAIDDAIAHATEGARIGRPKEPEPRRSSAPPPPRQHGQSFPGGIQSAPVNPSELGVKGSAQPPDWGRIQAEAAFEEERKLVESGVGRDMMERGPIKVPDTGINQAYNQVNAPLSYATREGESRAVQGPIVHGPENKVQAPQDRPRDVEGQAQQPPPPQEPRDEQEPHPGTVDPTRPPAPPQSPPPQAPVAEPQSQLGDKKGQKK